MKKLAKQVMILIEARSKEKKLMDANNRLDVIVNNIPIMLSSFDENGNFEWVNDSWVKELGWDLKSMNGRDMLSEFYPDPGKKKEVLDFMMHPQGKWKDFSLRKKDGTKVYTSWTNVMLANGKSIGIGQNIHTRKLTENALKSTNQRLDFILEGAGLGSWDWNLIDNSVTFDRRWCEMIGHKLEETPMLLSSWEEKVHPDDIAKATQDLQRHLEGKSKVYENIHRMKHKNGSWVWILDRGRISERDESGKPLRFTGTHFDITKQKEVEQELRDNEEKIHAIYEGSNDAIMMLTAEGFFDCNKRTLELFKVSSLDAFGTFHPSDLSPQYQPDGETSLEKAQKHIQTAFEQGHHRFEWVHTKSTKEDFPAEVLLSAFEYRGQKVLQATVRDITARKQLQSNLEQQRKLAQHHAKLASIGQLAAGVGHEINNPLAIIKGYISTIQEEVSPTKENQFILKMLEKVNIASDRIVNIVKGLRTFSRSDTDQLAQFCLKEALEESFNLVKDIYERENIHINIDIDANGSYFLHGNRGRIQQVIVNLLSNAKDASEGQEARSIHIRLAPKDKLAVLIVEDNGRGIPEEMKEKIFDPFFTTKDVNKGTGIGLSVVSSVIKEHEGEIWVESTKGSGAKFYIELPISKEQQTPIPVEPRPTKNRLPNFHFKAIIVDDEQDILDVIKFMLSRMGIDVSVAKNGIEALELFKKSPCDLILTDMKMPLMDGQLLIDTIANDPTLKNPKFILMTGGLDQPDALPKNLKQNIDGLLQKPFDSDTLITELRRLFPEKSK